MNVELILLNIRAHSIGISTVRAMEYCVPASCGMCVCVCVCVCLGGGCGEELGEGVPRYVSPWSDKTGDVMYLCFMYKLS